MVEIFDDRVEIYNPGGLPKGLPERDFGRRSVCRNPNIASLLLRCDYIEKMGSGIERIHTALAKENCIEVNIRYNTMFTLEFPRPTHKTSMEVLDGTSEKTTPQVTPQVARLLEIFQGEMTRGEIMKKLSLKDGMHFSRGYLTRAMESGYIEMTIPEKPNNRLQKYRLTKKGKTYVTK